MSFIDRCHADSTFKINCELQGVISYIYLLGVFHRKHATLTVARKLGYLEYRDTCPPWSTLKTCTKAGKYIKALSLEGGGEVVSRAIIATLSLFICKGLLMVYYGFLTSALKLENREKHSQTSPSNPLRASERKIWRYKK